MLSTKLQKLDGRHKMAIIAAILAWGVSMFFSKEGFSLDAHRAAWLGWILAGIGTVVELVFNTKTRKLSLTLIIVGILYYGYGIWTNVTGFWDYQHVGEVFVLFSQRSLLPWFVGTILEVLPEPLFMWGIGSELEGDLIGNIVGLWNGNLGYAEPSKDGVNGHTPQSKPAQQYNYHTVGKGSQRRNELEGMFQGVKKESQSKPSRHNLFGE